MLNVINTVVSFYTLHKTGKACISTNRLMGSYYM